LAKSVQPNKNGRVLLGYGLSDDLEVPAPVSCETEGQNIVNGALGLEPAVIVGIHHRFIYNPSVWYYNKLRL
jgi:hypothetical protein